MHSNSIVVMGVSGSGKSLIGAQLADRLNLPFYDADDFHSPANVRKMASGIPLSDADREGWLTDLADLIERHDGLVLACSALRRTYRDRLRRARPDLTFLYLDGDIDTIWERLDQRQDHYFNGRAMLESQFAQLEPPSDDEAIRIDIRESAEQVLNQCLKAAYARVDRSNLR